MTDLLPDHPLHSPLRVSSLPVCSRQSPGSAGGSHRRPGRRQDSGTGDRGTHFLSACRSTSEAAIESASRQPINPQVPAPTLLLCPPASRR
jgi:hypothetical protein